MIKTGKNGKSKEVNFIEKIKRESIEKEENIIMKIEKNVYYRIKNGQKGIGII